MPLPEAVTRLPRFVEFSPAELLELGISAHGAALLDDAFDRRMAVLLDITREVVANAVQNAYGCMYATDQLVGTLKKVLDLKGVLRPEDSALFEEARKQIEAGVDVDSALGTDPVWRRLQENANQVPDWIRRFEEANRP